MNVLNFPLYIHFLTMIHFHRINLLKMKSNLLYIRNQSVPRSKHFLPRLMMYKAKLAVCSEIRTKQLFQS